MESRRFRELKLRWPGWVWVVMGLVFFAAVLGMAARTARVGMGKLGTGEIKAAPIIGRFGRERADGVIYDSLLRARPGLMDTAREVEEYYLRKLK